jgi:hypothetical protein
MTSCSNTTREARAPGAGSLVSKSGASKGAVAAVAGDAIGCDFAVTNPSSTVTVKGASVTAGVWWRAGALVLVLVLSSPPHIGVLLWGIRLRTEKGWMGNTGLHGCLLRSCLSCRESCEGGAVRNGQSVGGVPEAGQEEDQDWSHRARGHGRQLDMLCALCVPPPPLYVGIIP